VTAAFTFDFAVAPKYIDARAVSGGATGNLYKIADPATSFDQDVTPAGLTADGDTYIVEAEA
jgi:hypothetical protein